MAHRKYRWLRKLHLKAVCCSTTADSSGICLVVLQPSGISRRFQVQAAIVTFERLRNEQKIPGDGGRLWKRSARNIKNDFGMICSVTVCIKSG
jgi:hypothetical protein